MKLVYCILFFAFAAHADITLTKLDFSKSVEQGKITISYKGQMRGIPELQVIGEAIQVIIPDSNVKTSMEKSVSFSSKLKDTQIRAYQTTAKETKIKAMLPFNVEAKRDQVALKLYDNKIELAFPRVKTDLTKAPQFGTIINKKTKAVKKDSLGKAYLDNLLKIEKKDEPRVIKPTVVKKEDTVQTALSATKTNEFKKDNFSFMKYGGKFLAFLAVVLLLFYGLMTLMKKGFIKKGKLGFLGSTDKILVLNQHYIAPKKSLMLIKAHNQVFLVSNTESGIHPISEIKDVAGLLKDEEKTLVGQNFDTNLDLAEVTPDNDRKVKLKEDISLSNRESSLSSYAEVKENIKFSDQIKQKVKGLKSLQ